MQGVYRKIDTPCIGFYCELYNVYNTLLLVGVVIRQHFTYRDWKICLEREVVETLANYNVYQQDCVIIIISFT